MKHFRKNPSSIEVRDPSIYGQLSKGKEGFKPNSEAEIFGASRDTRTEGANEKDLIIIGIYCT